jgi:hypothetical protein
VYVLQPLVMSNAIEEFAGGRGGSFSGWIPMAPGTTIKFWTGAVVDAIEINDRKYGGNGGSPSIRYRIDPGERLVGVSGAAGDLLDSVQFHFESDSGNKCTTAKCGGSGGRAFSMTGDHITHIGFHHGSMVDRLWVR